MHYIQKKEVHLLAFALSAYMSPHLRALCSQLLFNKPVYFLNNTYHSIKLNCLCICYIICLYFLSNKSLIRAVTFAIKNLDKKIKRITDFNKILSTQNILSLAKVNKP